MEEDGSASKILTVKLTGKRPLGRLRSRLEVNIKIVLEETWIRVTRVRVWVIGEQFDYGIETAGFISHGIVS